MQLPFRMAFWLFRARSFWLVFRILAKGVRVGSSSDDEDGEMGAQNGALRRLRDPAPRTELNASARFNGDDAGRRAERNGALRRPHVSFPRAEPR